MTIAHINDIARYHEAHGDPTAEPALRITASTATAHSPQADRL